MQDASAALFQLEFKQEAFLFLGLAYFGLLCSWIFALKDDLAMRFRSGGAERLWILFAGVAALAFGTVASVEWGLPFAGTAYPLGLCIGMALLNPSAAACLLASSLFLRPWELVADDSYLVLLPRLSLVLCLSHLALAFAQGRKRRLAFRWTPFARALLLFLVWTFVTTLFAPDPSASQREFFDGLLKSGILFFILLQMIRTPESLRLLLGTLVLSFLSVAWISIYESVRLGTLMEIPDFRLVGFGAFTNSNDIAALMVWILPFSVLQAVRKNTPFASRVVGILLGGSALVAIALSRSRGAFLGVGALLALALLLRMGRRALAPLAALALLLAIPATIFVFNRHSDDLEGSNAGRKTYLKAGLRMGLKNPIFGVGFDAFPESLQTYSTESLEEAHQMTAHNSWVLVFAETGVIGLFLFCSMFFTSARSAWKNYSTSPEFLLSLAGYGITILFLSHSYLIYPYLLFALIEIAGPLDTKGIECLAPSY